MAVEPNGSHDGAFWVYFSDHCRAKKFFSSHAERADAQALADQMNAEAEAASKQLLADAAALEEKQNSTPEDKHKAKIKRQDAAHLPHYTVRPKPGFVEAKVMGPDGEPTQEIAFRVVPKQMMGQALGAKVHSVPVLTRVPVMIPDPNWVNEE